MPRAAAILPVPAVVHGPRTVVHGPPRDERVIRPSIRRIIGRRSIMKAEQWHRVKEVCAEALDQPAAERAAFLDRACVDEPLVRAEVESLLTAHGQAGEFIEQPALSQIPATVDDLLADPNIGRALGPYVIEGRIGRGGMGTVYLARRADREFEQRVAIKMIRRGMDSDAASSAGSATSARSSPRSTIRTSPRLFDGGTTDDGLPYFVMEYVDGTPIDRYADEHRLTTADRLRLCLPVLDAVQHAHERHVVHRDLKPSNVLVTADGHPKLLDFGIAKILDAGSDGASRSPRSARPMTPDYASPEQVRGRAGHAGHRRLRARPAALRAADRPPAVPA